MTPDSMDQFRSTSKESLSAMFEAAKKQNEFAYVFSLLGIDSGAEDPGWQPIAETYMLMRDFVAIANAPFHQHTKTRLLLLCYTQITEANYLYHVIFNMLTTIENEDPPKVFNFLELYDNGKPPSVRAKVDLICKKADAIGHPGIKELLNAIFDYAIRNAISHADYILYKNELRLKHRGREIRKINLEDVFKLVQKTIVFFELFFEISDQHRKSYQDGHIIRDRKNRKGMSLANIILRVHPEMGLMGFEQKDPLPTW